MWQTDPCTDNGAHPQPTQELQPGRAGARLARLPDLFSIILANLVIGQKIVPELLQRDCTPEKLAQALLPLITNTPARRRQVEAFAGLDTIMGIGKITPSSQAAAIVLDMARRGRAHTKVAA